MIGVRYEASVQPRQRHEIGRTISPPYLRPVERGLSRYLEVPISIEGGIRALVEQHKTECNDDLDQPKGQETPAVPPRNWPDNNRSRQRNAPQRGTQIVSCKIVPHEVRAGTGDQRNKRGHEKARRNRSRNQDRSLTAKS